jgi:aminoglycoside phosphotransferase family enzyme/predicted kinase
VGPLDVGWATALDLLAVGPAPPGEACAAVVETHTSVVVLLGDRAFKVKKPVRLPFVDLSTRVRRRENCRDEVGLNRRFAPDVYLGVLELRATADGTGSEAGSDARSDAAALPRRGEPDEPGEPVVAMRRMPVHRRLSALVLEGRRDLAVACVDEVARQVAAAHAAQPPVRTSHLRETMAALWKQGREQMTRFADVVAPDRGTAPLDEVAALAQDYLRGSSALFDARERDGLVRDGHGDLLADDIFMLDDGPRILDCLEFDPRLRVGDVLADITFLAMDLEALGAPDLARRLMDRYREHSGECHPRSLEHHYVAYRAFVRTKVLCLRHEQGDDAAADRARRLLDLCRRHLRRSRAQLVLVGGLPGSGKSTLGRGLVDADPDRDWALVSSDVVRKELAGVPAGQSSAAAFGAGIYTPAWNRATYAEMGRRAAVALDGGLSVVLDATWTDAALREDAVRAAEARGATVTQICCEAPGPVCLARLAARVAHGPQESDADARVHTGMVARMQPWPQALRVPTDRPVELAVADVLETLDDRTC